jgi:hypothetical protein
MQICSAIVELFQAVYKAFVVLLSRTVVANDLALELVKGTAV